MQKEIAPARTFGFSHELDQMRNMGLIRGASLDNAICFDRRGVLNEGGLRFPDECCRHKALDLIGDLALIGKPLLGHVIAERAGHAMHAALVARIMSRPKLVRDPHVRPACDQSGSRAGFVGQPHGSTSRPHIRNRGSTNSPPLQAGVRRSWSRKRLIGCLPITTGSRSKYKWAWTRSAGVNLSRMRKCAPASSGCSRLDTDPLGPRRRGRSGTRELVNPSLPYVIVYHVAGETVHIVRVVHGAQDWQG